MEGDTTDFRYSKGKNKSKINKYGIDAVGRMWLALGYAGESERLFRCIRWKDQDVCCLCFTYTPVSTVSFVFS